MHERCFTLHGFDEERFGIGVGEEVDRSGRCHADQIGYQAFEQSGQAFVSNSRSEQSSSRVHEWHACGQSLP